MNYKTINKHLLEGTEEIPYQSAHTVFGRIYGNYQEKFLLESKDVSHIYGRLSLIGIDPVLKISGKGDSFEIISLQDRGLHYVEALDPEDLIICDDVSREEGKIFGRIEKESDVVEESSRSKRKNIAQIIRIFLSKFKLNEKALLGLYGAFSYDFVRLFEDIESRLSENDVNDFTLYLYDTFIFFDHLKEKAEIILFRDNMEAAGKDIKFLKNQIENGEVSEVTYRISDDEFSLTGDEYEKMVEVAKNYAEKGELFEVVFSNILKAKFDGDPFALYLKYRETNPSPYLFYFDFNDEQLVGASPEMMVRVEHGVAHLRPISGTIQRGDDPIEDHENMLKLLSDEKEKAELDMLVDLGRNDLSRVCKPGLSVTDYRFVEKYSRVMHTVAHVSGELRDGYTALDALIACLNAGTLTGAPKVAAMQTIEKHEKERRGYYGGTVGYLTFSGDMDTGIIIRTAHIKGDKLRFQVGATLLYDSVPKKEYKETLSKAEAFLNIFSS
ncbi:MAG: anthranilate synthase component I family protein [Patescibacteria group bacterium]